MSASKREKILVIRLGALGDLVLCCAAFAAIRRTHPTATIALLTMPAFADFARQMPVFDEVLIDTRPKWNNRAAWRDMAGRIKAFNPTRVYDLQGKFRQTILYGLLGGPFGPEWSGAAPLCSHPRVWPPKPGMHFVDFISAQLARCEVHVRRDVDMTWADAPIEELGLPEKYLLLIPGCAPTRLYKRWPAASYAALANRYAAQGIASVAIGTSSEAEAIEAIRAEAPQVMDLSGKTSLMQVAAIARQSVCVIGNDTGPTHFAAAVGAPTLSLFSGRVNPVWSSPRGPKTAYLQADKLADLLVEDVWQAALKLGPYQL